MKVLIYVVLAVVAATATANDADPHPLDHPEIKKKFEEFETVCKASENPSQADIDLHREHKEPTSPAGKCFVGCMMEHVGLLTEGTFTRTTAEEKVNKTFADTPEMLEKVLHGITECETEVGTGKDKCETGPKLLACMEKAHKAE